ncbi:hypothetical protein [Streptomyces sp. YIM 130001]|uniref:TraR/DksA family transcriptional regulator n=1 Tax=Streptomyces sp. YIM 130001 TaxID=2259644 RepID=UPI000E651993|nr:hypothetical protein [Streptomyces sp. YIM 130001]
MRQNTLGTRQRGAQPDDAGLTGAELAALADALRAQQRLSQDRLAGRAGSGSPDVTARMVLADVEEALERMRRGDYGRCGRCAGPIGPRHLEAVPQARYCVRCGRLRRAVRR